MSQDKHGQTKLMKNGNFVFESCIRVRETSFRRKTVLMPALKDKRKQLMTNEANDWRRFTKLRWVLEAIHVMVAAKFRLQHQQMIINIF